MEGRTPEQKEALIQRLSEAAAGELGYPPEEIRMVIYEVSRQEWGMGGKSVARRESESG